MTEIPAEAAGGRQFTAEELAAARDQLIAQGDLAPAGAVGAAALPDSAALGFQALADGAEAANPDVGEMLATIRMMHERISQLEAAKGLDTAPAVVRYAVALFDHLSAKAAAHPVINADLDHGYAPALKLAGAARDAAAKAAETPTAAAVADTGSKVAELERWIVAHARRFPQVDYSYLIDLAAEAAGAVAKLAA